MEIQLSSDKCLDCGNPIYSEIYFRNDEFFGEDSVDYYTFSPAMNSICKILNMYGYCKGCCILYEITQYNSMEIILFNKRINMKLLSKNTDRKIEILNPCRKLKDLRIFFEFRKELK